MIDNHGRAYREDSSASDDGGDNQSANFLVGGEGYSQSSPATQAPSIATISIVTSTISVAATTPTSTNNLTIGNFANTNSRDSTNPAAINQPLISSSDRSVSNNEPQLRA